MDQIQTMRLAMQALRNGARVWDAMDILEAGIKLAQVSGSDEGLAIKEWFDKTDWMKGTYEPKELGLHRADVLKQRVDRLQSENERLRQALHCISLASQNSMSSRRECGALARRALEQAPCDIAKDGVCETLECCKEQEQSRRKWQSLTDAERAAIQYESFKRGLTPLEFMELHEAKMKEKNA